MSLNIAFAEDKPREHGGPNRQLRVLADGDEAIAFVESLGQVKQAVHLMRNAAVHYIRKPLNFSECICPGTIGRDLSFSRNSARGQILGFPLQNGAGS
jgi:hypothetical protein